MKASRVTFIDALTAITSIPILASRRSDLALKSRFAQLLIWRTGQTLLMCAVSAGVAAQNASTSDASAHTAHQDYFLYIGSFTNTAPNGQPDGGIPSKGIYVARFNGRTGELGEPSIAAEVTNPTVLAMSPNHRFAYAISEISPEAFVTAYAIDGHSGRLQMLNKVPTGGAGTTYISLDRSGKYVLLANYGSGSVSVIEVEADGSLGKLTSWIQHTMRRHPGRPAAGSSPPVAAHPHSTVASPDDRYIVVPDFGLDQLFVYGFNADNGTLRIPATTVDLAPGEGPRHFVFSPNDKYAYLISQTTGNVSVFKWDSSQGALTRLQSVPSFPPDLDATNLSAEIALSPDGKFLYESNRRTRNLTHELGPDTIDVYQVDADSGSLTPVQVVDVGGAIPRCFSIDPSGAFLVVSEQQKNRIEVYRIDQESGKLFDTGTSVSIHTPACMQFVPAF